LRYLSRAEVLSNRKIQWAILTNGRQWRLYHQGAKSRLEEYFEVDVAWLLGLPGSQGDLVAQLRPPVFASDEEWRNHLLDVMWLMFRREAFLPGAGGRTFHQIALAEGREWEARVRESVADVVFRDVFPELLRALRRADPQAPPVRRALSGDCPRSRVDAALPPVGNILNIGMPIYSLNCGYWLMIWLVNFM
jgi:hypothetical protein